MNNMSLKYPKTMQIEAGIFTVFMKNNYIVYYSLIISISSEMINNLR